MGLDTPPCTWSKCEYFGKNTHIEVTEKEEAWGFFCTACRKSLRVLTKKEFRRDPKAMGAPDDTDNLKDNKYVNVKRRY